MSLFSSLGKLRHLPWSVPVTVGIMPSPNRQGDGPSFRSVGVGRWLIDAGSNNTVVSMVTNKVAADASALMQAIVRRAGIRIGQELIVNDSKMWVDWAARGILGIGETYMAGQWDAERVDVVMAKLARLSTSDKKRLFGSLANKAILALNVALNAQRPSRELEVAQKHYDLGNEFFASWLDSRMQYSCAYWKNAETLEQAQLDKMELIAQKLHLRPGMRVLDIGCGWGGLDRYLAQHYGVHVTGINISREQLKVCRAKRHEEGLDDAIELMETSYRNLRGTWDRIVVIGMLEHVGPQNYEEFFGVCNRSLVPGGVMLIQTIGSNRSRKALNDRWITKYIFPNGTLPSLAQLSSASERRFVVEDVHNFGQDYDRTLMAWLDNFRRVKGSLGLSETFVRMWEFYLQYTAAGFRERKTQLWQMVFSKTGGAGSAAPVRRYR